MSLNARFYPLMISEVRRETADAVSLLFDMPDDMAGKFAFEAGQYLTLRADIEGQDVRRTYSLCTAPSEKKWRVAIKTMPGGVFSSWANSKLKAGQMLDVLPPMGRFTAPTGEGGPHYVAIAGGSGITPVISILKDRLDADHEARVTLLYGNRDARSIMFLEELAGLKDRYMDRFELYHVLEDEIEDVELFNGRLDRAKCEEFLSGLVDPAEVKCFFVCGPGAMMDAVEEALKAKDVSAERIRIERFTTTPPNAQQRAQSEALHAQAKGTQLLVTLDGRQSRVSFDPKSDSILDSVQAAGLHAPYACRGGVCTTCRAKVIKGMVAMMKNYGLTEDEVEKGFILACQAVPTSEEVTLSFDV
jgi:ring-1,2-phenylacetyl-CoA epoxidase subunit PaaE